MIKSFFRLEGNNPEAGFWILSLFFLAYTDPLQSHFTLCPLHIMGITWCPGCGFGHAISFLLHGQITASIHAHPLGIFGFLIIIARIITIFKNRYAFLKQISQNP